MGYKIGLVDVDGQKFPNLALMKISAYHKEIGNNVEWASIGHYDQIYMSKVFTYTPDYDLGLATTDSLYKGGTGYNNDVLPEPIEHIYPDYTIYNTNKAYGFTTRGCSNKCSWCVVPSKEGKIKANAPISEFWNGQKGLVLMDNNILAHNHGIEQLIKTSLLNIKIDVNQGMEAKLIDNDIAQILSLNKWSSYIRLACDSKASIEPIRKAVELLGKHGVKPYKIFVYVLIKDIPDALERIEFLRALKVNPFAQPFRNFTNNYIEPEARKLARYVNHKAIFKSIKYNEYK